MTSRAGAQLPVNLSHNLQGTAADRLFDPNKIGGLLEAKLGCKLGDQAVIDFRQDLTRVGG